MTVPDVLCVVTGGSGDLQRAKQLCSALDANVTYYSVDKTKSKFAEGKRLNRHLQSGKWDLVYLEGTGIVGGLNLVISAKTSQQAYIVSSGDPVGGFFHVTKGWFEGTLFSAYERSLYGRCAGFIGWTPYLTGLALSLGARRAATVEGGADLNAFKPFDIVEKTAARASWQIPDDHLVCGVVGSLNWNERQAYSYGLELVMMLKKLKRTDISIMVVGGGSGLEKLQSMLPAALRERAVFTGRLVSEQVPAAINCMDIGFITQTLDGLGSFRLTTKLPEYLACGVPVAMSPVPGYFDYVNDAGWQLPPFHPSSVHFHSACAAWLDELSWDEVKAKAANTRGIAEERFDYGQLSKRFALFVGSLLREASGRVWA